MADNVSNSNDSMGRTTSPGGEFAPAGNREGFANNPHFEGFDRSGVMSESSDFMSNVSNTVSRYASTYDRSLRANPYLHIGLAGAGALALGYMIGRMTASPSSPTVRGMSEFDAAYDE